MELNLKAVFLSLALSAFVEGLFNFVTPFYLASQGISFFNIGVIFSISALAMVLLRISFGGYTDIRGRKTLFASAFLLQSFSSALFPFARSVLHATPVKILYDLSLSVKTSLKSTIVFENARETYHRMIAWLSGLELLMMALVNFAAAAILSFFTFTGSYFLMAVFQIAAFFAILFVYKEKSRARRKRSVSFKDMYGLHLKRNMWVLMFAMAFYTVGFSLSHGFVEPLFWEGKYALPKPYIGLVIGLHRLSLALPLFVTGSLVQRLDMKKAYIFSSLTLALLITPMGFIDNVYLAVMIWLLHDLLGGSIQIPVGQILTQLNARDVNRGRDTNTMQLLSGLASVVAPSLSGALITINWDLIFIVGGLLIFAAPLIIYAFYVE